MRKTKTYEISIVDKTYSKIISDETKFYTSDTALELGFELKETEYTFESAEIVLLNIDDRSLVTRPVAKNLDSFAYELDDDITAHYGEWRGQLRFEQAGETYVSSPVKFRIENDLSNDRPPQLSDVQSWVSLKRYADGLVDELKQAVANVEAMDDTFKANELDRDAAEKERQSRFEVAESERENGESVRAETFQTNETARQTTFETNESERNETFNTNEDIRKSQELEREKAEATRQANETKRQQAESQRQSTFETNETERQTTFETAEQERQSVFNDNEVTRQENENLRQQALGDMDGLYERIYPVSKNLFNHNQLSFGGRLDRISGGILDSEVSCYTEYIPVKGNTSYTISKQGEPYSAVSYDSEYNRIEGYILGTIWGDTTVNTPINASFLRYSFKPDSDYEKIMLNEGNEILPFEEYQEQGTHDKTVAGAFNYLLDNPQENGGGGFSEQVTMDFNAGEVINVEKYSSAILDLQFGAADYHLEGSRNGTDYEWLQVIKTDSGTPYQRISVRGEYAVNLTGYTHIQLVLDFLSLNPQNFRITLSTEPFKNNIDTRPNTFYAPIKPKFEYTLNETGNVTYLSGDKNGIVYGVTTDEVFKSSDYGKTWESLGTPATGAAIHYVQKLDNGNILAISKYGTAGNTEYFIMDATTGTWQSKYSHAVQGSYNHGFGFDMYDNVILFAPYQNPKEAEVIQVHYSNDYGETWNPIFDSPADILEWHIHDVAYDPYRDRIYIANGDNIDGLNADVIWSADEGKTWHHAFDGKPRSQFTAILPTPTQIIFGTDESRVRGAFRHPRGFDNPFVIDPAFHDMEPGGVNKHIVVGRGSHYWDTGNVAYFYARNPAEIYATKDGYNYFSMLKIGSDGTAGSLQNLSPLHNGKMAIGYLDKDGTGYVMVIENVEWEEV